MNNKAFNLVASSTFNIKGSAVINTLTIMKEVYGDGSLEKIKAAMSQNFRDKMFGKPILTISKIPYDAYLEMLATGAYVMDKPLPVFLEELSYKVVSREFKGILGIFIKALSPETLLTKIKSIWKQYYDQGEATAVKVGHNDFLMKITGISSFPQYHDLDIISSIKGILSYCKAKNISIVHTRCTSSGHDGCEYTVRWE